MKRHYIFTECKGCSQCDEGCVPTDTKNTEKSKKCNKKNDQTKKRKCHESEIFCDICKRKDIKRFWFPCLHFCCSGCLKSLKVAKNQCKCHQCGEFFLTNSIMVRDRFTGDDWYTGLKKATTSQILYKMSCIFKRDKNEIKYWEELTDHERKVLRPYGSAFCGGGDRVQLNREFTETEPGATYYYPNWFITQSYIWTKKKNIDYGLLNDENGGKRIISYEPGTPTITIKHKLNNFPTLILPFIKDETVKQLKLRIAYYWYREEVKYIKLSSKTIKEKDEIIAWIPRYPTTL